MRQRVAEPGLALRMLREEKGWTLAEVSRRTGLTVSTLSKIELNRVSLTYDKLVRLSAGLGVDLARLLDPQSAAKSAKVPGGTGRRAITRSGGGRVIATSKYNYCYPATELRNKKLIPLIAEARARSLEEFGELSRHPGEEFAMVIEGAVELHTELYEPERLNLGDSVYLDSGMGHAYIAVGPGPCRVLSISSNPEGVEAVLTSSAVTAPPGLQEGSARTLQPKRRTRQVRG